MDPFTLHYFGHYRTSHDPLLIEIVSLDRHMEVCEERCQDDHVERTLFCNALRQKTLPEAY